MSVKAELKSILEEGETKLVLTRICTRFKALEEEQNNYFVHSELPNLISLIRARHNELEKHKISGTLSNQELITQKNLINVSLLDFINRVPDNLLEEEVEKVDTANFVTDNDRESELKFDYFLCHSIQDVDEVNTIYSNLIKNGRSVFYAPVSLENTGGLPFFESIGDAILSSKNLLLVSSENAMKSEWVKAEYETFYNECYVLNPGLRGFYVLKGRKFNIDKVPALLKRFQFVDNIGDILKPKYNEAGLNQRHGLVSEKKERKSCNKYLLLIAFAFFCALLASVFYFSSPQNQVCPGLSDEPEMIMIKGGEFLMGTDGTIKDERPMHAVIVSDFYISKYETTVLQFEKFINSSNYRTEAESIGFSKIYNFNGKNREERPGVNWRHDSRGDLRGLSEYDHPVVHVTWKDANRYCEWLSNKTGKKYRLPTEAEWEYASRERGEKIKYSWGNEVPSDVAICNLADKSAYRLFSEFENFFIKGYDDNFATTAPVYSYFGNEYGLFNMSGNVWEWCGDDFDVDYYQRCKGLQDSIVINPLCINNSGNKVLRGGAWDNSLGYLSTTSRCYYKKDEIRGNIGFRVVEEP